MWGSAATGGGFFLCLFSSRMMCLSLLRLLPQPLGQLGGIASPVLLVLLSLEKGIGQSRMHGRQIDGHRLGCLDHERSVWMLEIDHLQELGKALLVRVSQSDDLTDEHPTSLRRVPDVLVLSTRESIVVRGGFDSGLCESHDALMADAIDAEATGLRDEGLIDLGHAADHQVHVAAGLDSEHTTPLSAH